jgi:cell division septation protein DedD
MDQNLKQRLVGASVIVALAVIFIPMLFDGKPVQGEHQVELRIPDKPNLPPLEKRQFNIDEPVGSQSGSASGLVHESIPLEAAIEPETVKPVVAARQTHHETLQQQIDTPADKSGDPTNPSSGEKIAAQNKAAVAEKKPEPAKKPSGKPASAASGVVYRVKIGSFSQRANAEKVRGRLLLDKLPTAVAKDPTRPLFHVYSPAFASKQSAVDYARKVTAASRKRVLNLGTPAVLELPADQSRHIEDQNAKAWVVQVGSFSSVDNARKLRDKLRKQGYTAFVDTGSTGKKTLYRVRVGPEVKRQAAEKTRDRLNKRLQIQGVIRPHELSDVVD